MIKPYTDAKMEYDREEHRYRLTEMYVLQRMNRNLSAMLADHGGASDTSNEAWVLLDRVSRQIYGYIYASTACPMRRERDMALDAGYRKHLRDAMAEQLVYILNNGDMTAYTGINLETGMTVDPARMRRGEIAPMAMDILARCGLSRVSITDWRDITPDYDGEGY